MYNNLEIEHLAIKIPGREQLVQQQGTHTINMYKFSSMNNTFKHRMEALYNCLYFIETSKH